MQDLWKKLSNWDQLYFSLIGILDRRFVSDLTADLSAAVDVYSDWVDACDAVAGDSPDGNDDTWTPPRAGRIAEEDQGRKVEDLELNRGVSDDDVEGESL